MAGLMTFGSMDQGSGVGQEDPRRRALGPQPQSASALTQGQALTAQAPAAPTGLPTSYSGGPTGLGMPQSSAFTPTMRNRRLPRRALGQAPASATAPSLGGGYGGGPGGGAQDTTSYFSGVY